MIAFGLSFLIFGQWWRWPKWLTGGLAPLTKHQCTVRAYIIIAMGIGVGIACSVSLLLRNDL